VSGALRNVPEVPATQLLGEAINRLGLAQNQPMTPRARDEVSAAFEILRTLRAAQEPVR
jgi:hypothetical protein